MVERPLLHIAKVDALFFYAASSSDAVALRSEICLSPKFQKNGGTQMFNSKNSYALNKKDANAIVYIDADGNIIRLTRADFSSEEEFLKWKSWSDADNHASEKRDHVHANHTLALDELSVEAASVPAMDVIMELELDRLAQIARSAELVVQIKACLSETQFRRVWMYFVDGMTIDEIGKKEGISHQNISKSIGAATKKIKKFFP